MQRSRRSIGGPFLLTLGGRLDYHSSFGNHFTPRISAAYQLNDSWKIRAGGGSAFRAPSVGDLYYPFYGNPDLKPETSRSYETGLDWTGSHANFSFTLFYSKYKDLITFDPVTFLAANIDRARASGIEISSAFSPARNWNLQFGYSFVDTEDESSGESLFRRPKNSGSITFNYAQTRWGWNVNFSMIGERFETDFNTFENRFNSGYVKADLAAFLRFAGAFKITGRIENFLDQDYEEAFDFPAPGITAYAGIHFEL